MGKEDLTCFLYIYMNVFFFSLSSQPSHAETGGGVD